MIWLVILTFFGGTAHVEQKQIQCPTYACVEDVVAHAHESQALTRLRVYHPDNTAGFGVVGNSVFPADTDWLFI